MAKSTDDRALAQARLQLESILKLVAAYNAAQENDRGEMDALENIENAPLAVSVRSDWTPPESRFQAADYQILISCGGPACRIVGDLERCEAVSAHLEYQDWFTPWQELAASPADTETLLTYARFFYFGN